MKRQITLSDLSAEECYCRHEDWQGKPRNGDTARAVDETIRVCPRARGGLNIGCAHHYMQDIKGVNWLFIQHLGGHPERKILEGKYRLLNQLKLYLDQLTRLFQGVNLDQLGDASYVEDPRYAAAVYSLDEHDTLRQLFEGVKSCAHIDQTGLLHQIDDLIISRMNQFLEVVRGLEK